MSHILTVKLSLHRNIDIVCGFRLRDREKDRNDIPVLQVVNLKMKVFDDNILEVFHNVFQHFKIRIIF